MSSTSNWRNWLNDDVEPPPSQKLNKHCNRDKLYDNTPAQKRVYQDNDAFRCCHCKAWVESNPVVAGVKHRNHCPYCLHSRHVDDQKTGDRCSECRAAMRPVGLTFKETPNKYSRGESGELMLIHLCLGCGKLSINRIAADDNAELIVRVFNDSGEMEMPLRVRIARAGIRQAGGNDLNTVLTRLYGACERTYSAEQRGGASDGGVILRSFQDQELIPPEE